MRTAVECASLAESSIATSNDIDAERRLLGTLVVFDGADGPTNVAECLFGSCAPQLPLRLRTRAATDLWLRSRRERPAAPVPGAAGRRSLAGRVARRLSHP